MGTFMSEPPDYLVLKRHRDLEGRRHEIWVRRGLLGVLLAIPVLALANVFGQHPTTSRAASGSATLEVYAPSRVRGGLLYEARFRVTAVNELKDAHLVLSPGWLEGMTVNTIEPSVSNETSANGNLVLSLGDIPAGHVFLLFFQSQVNPTNVGHRNANVALFDGGTQLVSLHRTITVFP